MTNVNYFYLEDFEIIFCINKKKIWNYDFNVGEIVIGILYYYWNYNNLQNISYKLTVTYMTDY